jgi:hypothetical protein
MLRSILALAPWFLLDFHNPRAARSGLSYSPRRNTLSVKGWQRAAALVPYFLGGLSDECGNRQSGFAKPVCLTFAQRQQWGVNLWQQMLSALKG